MKPKEKTGGRLLSVDVIRIAGLTLVLLHHMMNTKLLPFYISNISVDYVPYLFYLDYGKLGVWLFIFVSGCSLAASDTSFSSFSDVRSFYQKRFIRIYPAYWVSLLFSLFVLSWVMPSLTITDVIRWFSGFQAFFITNPVDAMKINITYWFIGVIVSLYLLYPLLLYPMKKHPNISLISFFFISLASRWIMYYVFPMFGGGWDWFPSCRLFNFGLGIYLIQKGLFPKAISNRTITFVSAMSYYVYLLTYPLVLATNYDGGIFFFVAGMVVFSLLLYAFDSFIKNLYLKRFMAKKNSTQVTTLADIL
jgi:peptidoglycan/LPS O-acetylase OafA/YrhL